MLRRVIEAVVPARLGMSFRWLLASSLVANIGDGIALAAGPLLVASQTADPLLVAMAALLQRLPWLLFGVFAGAVVDRLDRRRLIMIVNLIRAAVLAALTITVFTGTVNITIVLITMFLLGTAETFADTTSSTLAPSLVQRADLGIANARLQGGMIITNQLAGPPIGALIFALSMASPFLINAVCCALAAILVSRIVLTSPGERRTSASVRADIVEGWRWLMAHPPVRTLALTIVLFNVTFGAAWSVLVLYATERLGMNELGFGALTTASALGGIAATACYGALERRISMANLMRIGLIIETLTHLGLALTSTPWVALVIMVIFGAHAFVWGTTSTTVRQRSVPAELMGRVTSVYLIGVVGGLVIGSALGGVIARQWGITGPFWFGFIGSALLTVAIWRELSHIARPTDPT
ncbi:MFS transporter [Microlunatus speluncae]|uniref:MFS transporter n=1 Tax=Microlunatus speluncae TaxID=2594267 RepID=UPI001FECBF24|nr:MFS transporter [Microlunatus speluncae]